MKLNFVIAFVTNLFAVLLFRLLLWVSTFQVGLPEGMDTGDIDSWFNMTSLVVFMWLTIRQLLIMLKAKDKRNEELTNKVLEIIERQTDLMNKTFGSIVEKK